MKNGEARREKKVPIFMRISFSGLKYWARMYIFFSCFSFIKKKEIPNESREKGGKRDKDWFLFLFPTKSWLQAETESLES